jgi:GGDEF domain-containing protein
MDMEPSFPSEQNERKLTKDEMVRQYRDHYETPAPPSIELADPIIELQPRFIQHLIAERIEQGRRDFNDGKPFPPVVEQRASIHIYNEIEDSELIRDKTGLRTEWYVRKKIADTIDAELRNEAAQRYDHIALFVLDLDGLKALNDLYHRSAGDAYLQRVADWLKDSKTLHSLAAEHISITLARAGSAADEYMIFANGAADDQRDWEAFWSETSVKLQEELANLDVTDIWPTSELMRTIDERDIRSVVPVPEDMRFRARAGLGRTTLEYILTTGEGNRDRQVTRNDTAETMTQKLTGAMIDVSLRYMKKHKNWYKEDPMDDQDRTLVELIRLAGR